VCSTVSWWIIWPFETLKSQVQANTPGPKGLFRRFLFVARHVTSSAHNFFNFSQKAHYLIDF